jgi:hypothetical protein
MRKPCPQCQVSLEIADEWQGKSFSCPHCGATFLAPIILLPIAELAAATAPQQPAGLRDAPETNWKLWLWPAVALGVVAVGAAVWFFLPGQPHDKPARKPASASISRTAQQRGHSRSRVPTPSPSEFQRAPGSVPHPTPKPPEPPPTAEEARPDENRPMPTPGASRLAAIRARRAGMPGPGRGTWAVRNDCLVQSFIIEDARFLFGDTAWRDYEFTLEARKDGGSEGFLVIFRATNPSDLYWFNIGGWSNSENALERHVGGRKEIIGPKSRGEVQQDRWYSIRVRCEGTKVQLWMEGQQLLDYTDSDPAAHLGGCVGVGTWQTQASFRNLKVATLEGTTLFSGLPDPAAPQTGSGGASGARFRSRQTPAR